MPARESNARPCEQGSVLATSRGKANENKHSECLAKKRVRVTTMATQKHPEATNLLNRKFQHRNMVLPGDVTHGAPLASYSCIYK